MAALEIRKDRTPAVLRRLAKETDGARVARRILAIANALDGMSRDDASRSAGMDRQTLRDWVLRYNAHGVDGLVDRWNGGRPPTFTPAAQSEIVEMAFHPGLSTAASVSDISGRGVGMDAVRSTLGAGHLFRTGGDR